jgi:Clp amino terminal domain, pathogenicity island component
MFERFHQDAREALARAREEAAKSGHREIHTKHLLLGLLAASGHASDALTAAGADPAELRAEVPLSHAVPSAGPDGSTVGGATVDAPAAAGIATDEAVAVLPPRDGGAPGSAALGSTAPDSTAPNSTGSDETRADDAPPDGALADDAVAAGAASEDTGGLRMTHDARTALEHARRTAQRFKHQRVSTGHVLLGIIDEPGNSAVGALTVAGIHVGTLRADVLRRLEVEGTVSPHQLEP